MCLKQLQTSALVCNSLLVATLTELSRYPSGCELVSNQSSLHYWSIFYLAYCCSVIATTGGYCTEPEECICHYGFGGVNCEVDILPCENLSPCQNGGTCNNDNQGGYTCACPLAYEGDNCESERNECSSSPCFFGTCTVSANTVQHIMLLSIKTTA